MIFRIDEYNEFGSDRIEKQDEMMYESIKAQLALEALELENQAKYDFERNLINYKRN